MLNHEPLSWTKESLRSLRLRLGWSKSDLARRLKCSSSEIDLFEDGGLNLSEQIMGELEIIYFQAEACCDEIQLSPAAEAKLEQNALDQIDFSRVKADFE